MVRTHGIPPYSVVLVHGGPGAAGSLQCIGEELGNAIGTIESLQTRYSINALIEELKEDIAENARAPVTLLGHSWGAWLIVLFAHRHPSMAERLILVGAGALEERYGALLIERRLAILKENERQLFIKTLSTLEQEGENETALSELKRLTDLSDAYALLPDANRAMTVNAELYAAIWNEAKELRSNGALLNACKTISVPITIIHGERDPHPIEGVTEPLTQAGVPFELHTLAMSGHSPFLERYAKDEFYRIVKETLSLLR